MLIQVKWKSQKNPIVERSMNRASEMAAFSANMASMPADAALLDGVVVEPVQNFSTNKLIQLELIFSKSIYVWRS